MTPKRKGRKPLALDAALVQRLTEALRVGNYVDDACEYAGISRGTYYAWMERGRAEQERITNGEPPNPEEAHYLDILNTVNKVRAEAVVRNVTLIQNAARNGTWQAAAWWLERTRPDKYGRRVAAEVTGKDGGPVQVEVTAEALDARIAELLGETPDNEDE